MSLQAYSARLNCPDPDALNTTRLSGTDGLFLAPSWAILTPAKEAFAEALALAKAGQRNLAAWLQVKTWETYTKAFFAEMAASQEKRPEKWAALLARPRVVLTCYCGDRTHCHTVLLRRDILPGRGAVDCGEWKPPPPKQLGLFVAPVVQERST